MSVVKYQGLVPTGLPQRKPYLNLTLPERQALNGVVGIPPMGGPGGPGGPDGPGGPGGPPGGPGGPPGGGAEQATIFIKDGELSQESAQQYLYGGKVDASSGKGLRIVAYKGDIGGIYVEGSSSDFTLEDSAISLSGDGMGLGGKVAGFGVSDHGHLTVKNCVVDMNGASRTACSNGQSGILKVYDSMMISHGAPYGEDAPEGSPKMGPPAALEIAGNCRTHCTVDHAFSYFYNSTIMTDGWAALSTDMAEGFVYMEANDCRVIATKSGYGAYADTCCHDVFNRCYFQTGCMAGIMAGICDMTFRDCVCDCGTYFVLMHCVMGQNSEVGDLVVKNSKIHSGKATVIIKSQNALIDMENTQVESDAGIFLHSVWNDDREATKVHGQEVYGIQVKLKDMEVKGDVLHEDPERRMHLYLTSAALIGAIQNAELEMDSGSRWYATGDSVVKLYGAPEEAQIDAPAGVTIQATGMEAGEYTLISGGKLIVTV